MILVYCFVLKYTFYSIHIDFISIHSVKPVLKSSYSVPDQEYHITLIDLKKKK